MLSVVTAAKKKKKGEGHKKTLEVIGMFISLTVLTVSWAYVRVH